MEKSPREVYNLFRESMIDNTELWKSLISENVELVGPLLDSKSKGKANFIEINMPFFQSILSSDLHELIESGNRIVTRVSTTVGLPNGKALTLDVNEWYYIEDGKITSLITYFDPTEFRKVFEKME